MASAPLQQQQEIPTKAPPDEIKSADALNNLIKSLQSRTKGNSESGSSNGGDHSDNSALVSLGNTSFGFNFDSEEGCSNNSKEGQNDSNEDSDGNVKAPAVSCSSTSANKKRNNSNNPQQKQATGSSEGGGSGASDGQKSTTSSLSSSTNSKPYNTKEQNEAAANAVANLASIARSYPKNSQQTSDTAKAIGLRDALERKRKAENDKDADSGGYNTDDDEGGDGMENTSSKGGAKSRKMKREETGHKREERNQREKERSFRISKQITDLRNLLSSGGVVVPKGTKSSVLTEAANYIRMLQQHQYRSEIDRYQLVQQMQAIGSGAHGEQAATAVRHYAAQNGVWTLGNFGGVPPKSAMTFAEPPSNVSQDSSDQFQLQQQNISGVQSSKVESSEYRFIFNSCGAGMAISSMGGAFIDCNQLFCQLSNYTKQEICSLTLFNLTARQDLQHAFDQISRMISPPMDVDQNEQRVKPIVLRGAMKNRDDLGMSVSLVKGDDGIAKCFCITLVKNPSSPFDTSKPVPVSFDAIQTATSAAGDVSSVKQGKATTAPAFTSG